MHVSLDRVEKPMVCHHGTLHPNHCDPELHAGHHYEAASLGNHNHNRYHYHNHNHNHNRNHNQTLLALSLDLLCDGVVDGVVDGDGHDGLGWRDPLRLVGLT